MTTVESVVQLLADRERDNPITVADRLYDAEYFVRRLCLSHKLEGHRGCVNAIAWDASGRWMVSGSDDCRLNVWSPFDPRPSTTTASSTATRNGRPYLVASLPTSHRANIFACKFLQSSTALQQCPEEIISCSARGLVQYSRGLEQSAPSNVGFRCHTDMAFDVEPDPLTNARTFLSCSQDGTVNLYDLRVRTECRCEGCNRHTYIDVNAHPNVGIPLLAPRRTTCKSRLGITGKSPSALRAMRPQWDALFPFSAADLRMSPGEIGVTCMSVRPENPVYLSVGCTDDFVRTYDRRYLSVPVQLTPQEQNDDELIPSSVDCLDGLVYEFCPSHMRKRMYTNVQKDLPSSLNDEEDSSEHEEEEEEEVVEEEELSVPRHWSRFAHNITSLCYDPSGSGDLLVSYSSEFLYTIRPSNIRPYTERQGSTTMKPSETLVSPKKRAREASSTDIAVPTTTTTTSTTTTRDYAVYYPKYKQEYTDRYDQDILAAYTGHRNSQTMIKEARFFHYPGLQLDPNYDPDVPPYFRTSMGRSLWVLSGSDDGHIFVWPKTMEAAFCAEPSGGLQAARKYPVLRSPAYILKGDGRVVNCLQPHPHLPMLACSGIDHDIKVFLPTGGYGSEWQQGQEQQTQEQEEESRERGRLRAIEALVMRNTMAPTGGILGDQISEEEEEEEEHEEGVSESSGDEMETAGPRRHRRHRRGGGDVPDRRPRRWVLPTSVLMQLLGSPTGQRILFLGEDSSEGEEDSVEVEEHEEEAG